MIITHSVCLCGFQIRMVQGVQVDLVVQVAHHSLSLVVQMAPEGLVGQ